MHQSSELELPVNLLVLDDVGGAVGINGGTGPTSYFLKLTTQ